VVADRDVDRGRPRLGLALSGGAARGMAHIGVLQAVCEAGIEFDYLAGTSAGSIMVTLLAAGVAPEKMAEAAHGMRWRHCVRLTVSRYAMLTHEPMIDMIKDFMGPRQRLEDMPIPVSLVAVDLRTGRRVVLDRGDIGPAILASCAVPGVFEPVRLNDWLLVDGGVTDNLPASVVRDMGADVVVAVDVNYDPVMVDDPRSPLHVALRAFEIMRGANVARDMEVADINVRPDVGRFSLVDLRHAKEMIAAGYQAGREAVPEIRRRLGDA